MENEVEKEKQLSPENYIKPEESGIFSQQIGDDLN